MALKGNPTERSKIAINKQPPEQANNSNFL